MKKKLTKVLSMILTIALLASMSAASLTSSALELRSKDFGYEVMEDGTVRILEYYGKSSNVAVPEEINGREVTTIAGSFGTRNGGIITSLTLPATVYTIEDDIKYTTPLYNLKSINVDASSLHFTSVDGVLFTKDKTILDWYPVNSDRTSYKVPEGTKHIKGFAFASQGVNYVRLEEITFPNSLRSVGGRSFMNCYDLKKVKFNDGLKAIRSGAFVWCNSLDNVTLPKSVNEIEDEIFEGCASLKNIDIPEGVKTIDIKAFAYCENLKKVRIPKSVKEIKIGAFYGCNSLNDVYYNGTQDEWNKISIDNWVDNTYVGGETTCNAPLFSAKMHFANNVVVKPTEPANPGKPTEIAKPGVTSSEVLTQNPKSTVNYKDAEFHPEDYTKVLVTDAEGVTYFDWVFAPNSGTNVDGTSEDESLTYSTDNPGEETDSNNNTAVIVLAVVAVLVIAGGAVYFVMQKKKQNKK